MRLNLPPDLDPARFMSDYWQQRPLFIPQGLAGIAPPLSADELAGLACEPEVEARLILERGGRRPWEVRHGPFDEGAFQDLPETHWTLLVQDVDKHLPRSAAFLDPFRFVPDWRFDDLMVSYAADQGSVGPHIDEYDVFLVQVQGTRRWRIHTRPVADDEFIPDLDLRLLPRFEAEQEWLARPGDVLYLPPRVAHWGIAEGECMTCSVGFRAPALRELAHDWAETLVEETIPASHYRDPARNQTAIGAEIPEAVVGQFQQLLAPLQHPRPDLLRRWLGCFLTEPKVNLQPEPPVDHLDGAGLRERLLQGHCLVHHPYARFAFIRGYDRDDWLCANGEALPCPQGHQNFLRRITGRRELCREDLRPWLSEPRLLDLLAHLYNLGALAWAEEDPEDG